MKVQGCDCSIVIKTTHMELDVPYSEETLREAYSLLQEEAAIEGNGSCRAIRKNGGVTGCVVTPLTISSAPLLLYLALGSAGIPVFVSETRSLYQYRLSLLPMEDTDYFDLVQNRGGEKRLFEGCRVKGFELRFEREQNTKLKLDIHGEYHPVSYPHGDNIKRTGGECFNGCNTFFYINKEEYKNIYGLTISAKKEAGTKTEIWIRRALDEGGNAAHSYDIPEIIDELTINAQMLCDRYVPSGRAREEGFNGGHSSANVYEYRRYGTFSIKIENLVLVADGTNVNTADAVIGPLRYYASGAVSADVFSNSDFHVGV